MLVVLVQLSTCDFPLWVHRRSCCYLLTTRGSQLTHIGFRAWDTHSFILSLIYSDIFTSIHSPLLVAIDKWKKNKMTFIRNALSSSKLYICRDIRISFLSLGRYIMLFWCRFLYLGLVKLYTAFICICQGPERRYACPRTSMAMDCTCQGCTCVEIFSCHASL